MPETIQERQASLNEELLSAASEGDIDRMRRAIARGASLKAGMEEGGSLARAAGPGGNGKRKKEALEWLLGLGALKMITAEKAGLALRSAIKGKIAGAADLLAKAGAAVEARDEKGRTGVWEAANLGDADWVRKWLRLEADPRAKSADGDEPLHAACKAWMGNAQFPIDEKGLKRLEGHRRCAKLLVKAGADLDAKGAGGNSPAHVAALFG